MDAQDNFELVSSRTPNSPRGRRLALLVLGVSRIAVLSAGAVRYREPIRVVSGSVGSAEPIKAVCGSMESAVRTRCRRPLPLPVPSTTSRLKLKLRPDPPAGPCRHDAPGAAPLQPSAAPNAAAVAPTSPTSPRLSDQRRTHRQQSCSGSATG